LLSETDLLVLARTLANLGVKKYALQLFRKQGSRDAQLNAVSLADYPSEGVLDEMRGRFLSFDVRRG
jgi:hypothetical protein